MLKIDKPIVQPNLVILLGWKVGLSANLDEMNELIDHLIN